VKDLQLDGYETTWVGTLSYTDSQILLDLLVIFLKKL